jgi:hypothetical protein
MRVFVKKALAVVAFSVLPLSAQLIALEPSEAGPDFVIQGEYSGWENTPGGGSTKLGAQMVALGDGNFRVVFFPGGLPGDGWTGLARYEDSAKTTGAATEITGEAYHGTLKADTVQGQTAYDQPFTLIRKDRISPTAGLPPPPQATVLFNGGSLDAWDNAVKDDRSFLTPLDPLAVTRKKFSNFSLHLEFREPFMPFIQGQGRGNSGIKLMTADMLFAEIQIVDSFGNEPLEDECGGIEILFAPDLVASFPPLTWQTYDIHLSTPDLPDSGAVDKAIITVWHNGILIHAGRTLPAMARAVNIALQKNSDPVFFRNIWIIEGDDGYPFFPGSAVRGRKAEEHARPYRGGSIEGLTPRFRGPAGFYTPDGRRLP